MKTFFKCATVFFLIFLFLGLSFFLGIFVRGPVRRQKRRAELQSVFCRWGLWVLQVQVSAEGREKPPEEARLMVGNHMSYLDVLVLSSLYSSSYVTSQEIRETPFLGLLCEWAGCLFVERRNKAQLHQEVAEIRQALQSGLSVTIFPEATSTNGEEILRFRSPLYHAAFDADAEVQPFCLNYVSIDGKPFSKTTRDLVCWYGDMDFLPHLWALCRLSSVKARVRFLEVMEPSKYQGAKEMAMVSRARVAQNFEGLCQ